MPMILSYTEGQFCSLKHFLLQYLGLTTIYLHRNRKAHVYCNFSCLIETKRLLKDTGNHVRYEGGYISEIAQDWDVTAVQTISISNSGNPDKLEWPSRSLAYCKRFQIGFFVQCSKLTRFQLTTLRRRSAKAESLVWFDFRSIWTSFYRQLHNYDKLYSQQMVVTIYKYAIENDLTKKKEKRKKKNTHTNKWHVLF